MKHYKAWIEIPIAISGNLTINRADKIIKRLAKCVDFVEIGCEYRLKSGKGKRIQIEEI